VGIWDLSVKLTKLAPMEYYLVMISKVFVQFWCLEKFVKRDRGILCQNAKKPVVYGYDLG